MLSLMEMEWDPPHTTPSSLYNSYRERVVGNLKPAGTVLQWRSNETLTEQETVSPTFEDHILLTVLYMIDRRLPTKVKEVFGPLLNTGELFLMDIKSDVLSHAQLYLPDLNRDCISTTGNDGGNCDKLDRAGDIGEPFIKEEMLDKGDTEAEQESETSMDVNPVGFSTPSRAKLGDYKCEVCGKTYNGAASLVRHCRVHRKKGSYAVETENNSNSEQTIVIQGEESLAETSECNKSISKCSVCGKEFTRSFELKRHFRTHTGEKTFKCDYCGKAFSQSCNLKYHVRIHSGEKPFKCKFCGKEFASNSYYKVHTRIHTGERPYVCSVCGKTFTARNSLDQHLRTHDGEVTRLMEKTCICSVCGRGFSSNQRLEIHTRTHTGEKPYKCSICGKECSQSGQLNHHLKMHKGVKPHKCDVCGKDFSQTGHLKVHMMMHRGEKPFNCSVCGKGFSQAGNMRQHEKTHSDKNSPIISQK